MKRSSATRMNMKFPRYPLMLIALLALAGCVNLAPDYKRPEAPVPSGWRDAPEEAQGQPDAQKTVSIDTRWEGFVSDERLRDVVRLALDNNRDLRVALHNVEVARATYRIQRADLFPSIDAGANASRARTPATAAANGIGSTSSSYSVNLGMSAYELDLFGRVRNLSEAALQDYLSQVETQRSAELTLVAETVTAWLTLAADQQQLELAKQTYESRRRTHDMQTRAQALGGASGLTVAQSRSSLEAARVSVASYESQVRQDLNALELLAGSSLPQNLLPLTGQPGHVSTLLVSVPADLSSSVLQQRPDVQAAEHTLMAANANIGAARAAFFPSISLTASGGTASRSLGDLFSSGSGAWSFAPSISLPIFDMGSRQASLDAARAQQAVDLASYEKAIQTAFREVADALAVRSSLAEQMQGLAAQVEASRKSLELSTALQREGSGSFLDVLDAQRTLYAAEQSLLSMQLTEQLNRVTLYKALGGGMGAAQ